MFSAKLKGTLYNGKVRIPIILLFLLALTSPAYAAETSLSAGVPKTTVWISKTNPIDGDKVKVFTPLYNSTDHTLSGDVTFTADGTAISTVHIELNPHDSKIVSTEWKAVVGAHALGVKIENTLNTKTSEAVTLLDATTNPLSLTVAEAPPQPLALQVLSTVASAVSTVAASAVPVVSDVAGAVFEKTEAVRTGAVTSLERALGENTDTQKPEGQVLGAETFRDPSIQTASIGASHAPTSGIMRFFLRALLIVVQSVWLFYPLITIFLLFILFMIGKTVARPSYVNKS